MKTIEGGIKYYIGEATQPITAFKQGVEFAQQWISVEDELPEEYKQSGYSKQVLCKTTMGSFVVLYYDMEYNRFTAPAHVEVTHWRPIEFNKQL